MRLSYNRYLKEWVAVRHGNYIIAHNESLDVVIAQAIVFICNMKGLSVV